ncbi:HAD-IIB family hydrolase [Erysipelothrix urinaevulpis]|uniref:HAD-IIB family hydrolase n=1 Tax=Erysipelothrix urinaevulpis TaxID=2683717 RepID=UPI001359208F|nr:HAD-IIB family hydrolase [Erysipelothrix urinaevulpis]
MKKSDVFYFDIDGTILDNKANHISKQTIYALKELQRQGYKVALCTGRTKSGIIEANVHDLIVWDGYVLANGSIVLDENQAVISEVLMDPTIIHHVQDDIGKKALLLEGHYNFLTYPAHDRILDALDHFGIDANYPIETFENQAIFNVLCYDSLSEKTLDFLKVKTQIFKDQLGNLEIIPLQSGKENGIKTLNKHFNATYHTVFGDGENDLNMLKQADFSVAMGNAEEALFMHADFIAKRVDENGIYHALIEHGLIQKENNNE